MKGYVAQRRGRFYAVIYEGRDPVTGKELRHWHPAGTAQKPNASPPNWPPTSGAASTPRTR